MRENSKDSSSRSPHGCRRQRGLGVWGRKRRLGGGEAKTKLFRAKRAMGFKDIKGTQRNFCPIK